MKAIMAVINFVVPWPQPEPTTDTADDLPVFPTSLRTSIQILRLFASTTPTETLDHVICGWSVVDRTPEGLNTVPVEVSCRCAGP
jgi:hypothetical protein